MKTLRHYFISDNLDDIEAIEEALERKGVTAVQIHVLSNDDVGVANHIHLHEVQSFLRQDVIHSAQVGAVIGFWGAVLTILVAYGADLPAKTVGWMPYAFLAIIVFGFCIWEGGLLGIQEPNHQFRPFESALREGKHVFIVDVDGDQQHELAAIVRAYPKLVQHARTRGTSGWVFHAYNRLIGFIDRNLLSQSQIH